MTPPIPSARPASAGIVSLHTPGGELETTNTDLAAALAALGIPLRKHFPVRQLEGARGRQLCFYFEERSLDGRFETADMIRVWRDPDFLAKFPEHPMAYLSAAFQNRSRLLDYVKSGVPMFVHERGKKIAFIPANSDGATLGRVEREMHRR